ncbi:hypothetical protein INT44_009159 [Umbelopsis vinacea]|uniref:Pleckstrin homology domain-containing protein n=1 Tax=Umbelopsis vinacea TaxID=44442 RepID=A0A8H7Q336_9FUNG|nr:hypothetical protein INT44_009159 [Umbelopsis vinacea]
MTSASALADDTKAVLMDFGPEVPVSFSNLSVETIKIELVKQLEGKERLLGELSGGGISRNVLQRQINQIKERLHDLEQMDDLGELDKEDRIKLESLERELSAVKSVQGTPLPTPRFFGNNSTSLLPSAINSSTPTKRRSKVPGGSKRNTDIEFATEIGQGLLIEVRKLQAALQNKEEIIKQLHIVKSDDERTTEMLMKHLKQKEESEERYKEQNWGLEVTNEELQTSLAESNQFVNKSKIENARLTKQLRLMSEQNDSLKTQVEKSAVASESTKLRHEQDIQALKRTIANLQRENMTFKEKVQTLDSELDIQRTKLSIRSISNDGTNRDEKPGMHRKLQDITPQASTSTPIKSNNQQLELTTAKQSLTHAHRMINNLRTSLQKEKQEKHELTKLLSESQETVENLQHEVSNLNALGKSRAKAQKRIERKTSKRTKSTGTKATTVSTGADLGVTSSQAAEPDWDDTIDDSASEKSLDPDAMDISYMNGDQEMQSLGSELANSMTLQEQLAPVTPDTRSVVQSTEAANIYGQALRVDVSLERSLSTSILEPLTAVPADMNNAYCQTPASPMPQRTLSTSILEPLSMPPVAESISASQTITQPVDVITPIESQRTLDMRHLQVHEFNVEPRQRELSVSSVEPLDVPPVEYTTLTQHIATQTAPRQRTLSTSAMEPMNLPPIEVNVVTLQAGTQTGSTYGTQMGTQTDVQKLEVIVPLPRQRTLSTASLEPLSAVPEDKSMVTLQNGTQTDANALGVMMMPFPRQRTLSTSSMEPLSIMPIESNAVTMQNGTQTDANALGVMMMPFPRQRTLSTSSMEPLSIMPIESNAVTMQNGTQTDANALGVMMMPFPRQRTLSTSSMEPLSAMPIESNAVTMQNGTQTDANALGVMMMPFPRQRTLSTSSMEPLSAMPIESNSVAMQNGTQTDANALGVITVPLPRQRTLSTSTMEPLSAVPIELNAVTMQNGTQTDANALGVMMMPFPRQRTLSTSSMEPLSAVPVESNAVTLQSGTQTDSDTLGVMVMPISRQRTLSTSSMEPLSAVPIELHVVALQSGTQTDAKTLDVKIAAPRERTLSTSSMEPLNIPPTESTIVTLQTAMQTDMKSSMQIGTQTDAKSDAETDIQINDLEVPSQKQRTLSTSNMAPLSAEPAEAKHAALQTPMEALDVARPAPRQRTLSTTTMEPLSAVPRQRKLSTSALDPLDVPPVDSGSIAVQTSTQVKSFDTITQQHFDNLDEAVNVEYGHLKLNTTAYNIRNERSLDTPSLHVESPEDMFGANSQWDSTLDLSLHITPADSLPKRSEIDYSVDNDMENQQSDKEVSDIMEANNEVINTAPPVDASVQVAMDDQTSSESTPLATPIAEPHVEVDTVDTATSPISSFFPSDIHSTNYVAGPNGEDMVTRKEAEALATAYLADAMSKDKAEHISQRLAWEQKRLLQGSSMAFLNAPPRPERPPSPMLIAKTQKPPVTPKMHITPSPKPSVSTPIPLKNKSIRSSPSISSLRPSDSVNDFAQDKTRKDEYGHAIIRKKSFAASSSSSLTSSPVESLSEHSLQRKASLVSQSSLSLYNSPSTPSSLSVITAITKTMIGDWLWKYTRRTVGGGISEHRHRRFFWVHPYTRTLYWSAIEPGVDGSEALAKSAYVEAVMSVPNRGALNDTSASLLIKTPNRELKLTAPDMERHALWYKSLSYLLDRPAIEQPSTVSSIDSVQRTQSTRLPRKPSFQRMQSLFSRSRPADEASSFTQEVRREVKPSLEEDHEHCESDCESHEDVRQCCDGKHHLHSLSQRAMPPVKQ